MKRLGFGSDDLETVARKMQAETVKEHPEFPTWEELPRNGRLPLPESEGTTGAAEKNSAKTGSESLDTPSGKIEIYSEELAEMAKTWEFEDPPAR